MRWARERARERARDLVRHLDAAPACLGPYRPTEAQHRAVAAALACGSCRALVDPVERVPALAGSGLDLVEKRARVFGIARSPVAERP